MTASRTGAAVVAALAILAAAAYWGWRVHNAPVAGSDQAANAQNPAAAPDSVDLSETQLAMVKVEPVEQREFPHEKTAVGSIGFNEELSVQVFTPYQGRIVALFGSVGDDVKKGQTLFTIDSPDLLQAESALIAAAGVLELNTRNLARLKDLFKTLAVSQHDVEQATSDQQTAEGNLRAARDTVRLFGKTDADIQRIIDQRSADPTLVVRSPIDGRITARNAAPGLFVQPGGTPAPYTVANIDTMWMLAQVAEADIAVFHVGQEVRATVSAFPGRIFDGKVTTIGASVDPNSRRILVRSQVNDPGHELRAGMFATFVISVAPPDRSPAIPIDGVVREGNGTMTAWVTTDRHRFTQRTVKTGEQHGGYWQILEGVQAGEMVATTGALFLSNALNIASP